MPYPVRTTISSANGQRARAGWSTTLLSLLALGFQFTLDMSYCALRHASVCFVVPLLAFVSIECPSAQRPRRNDKPNVVLSSSANQ
jgi:hypothetical protein